MDLVIMAAGMGSRFGGLKQIEPINSNGEFIIDYSIFDAIRHGFTRIVFIIKKENYKIFRQTVGKRIENKIEVAYVFQELDMLPDGYTVPEGRVKPWGTVHAILCCDGVVDKNFAIVNADDFYGEDAYRVIAEFLKGNTDNSYGLVGYKANNTLADTGATKRGICHVENGRLVKIVESNTERIDGKIFATPIDGTETKEISPDTVVSMNMFGFTPQIFPRLKQEFTEFLKEGLATNPKTCEYIISTFLDGEISGGQVVKVLNTTAVWHGVTYKEDKPKVVAALNQLTLNGKYPTNLWG